MKPSVFLTTSTTFTHVSGACAKVYDKKTGKLLKVVPEKDPDRWQAIDAGALFLEHTDNLRGVEPLREQTTRLLASLTENLTAALLDAPLTTPTTITVVTPAYAIVYDKKTGKIVKVVPEKDPRFLERREAIEAGAAFLEHTENLRGVEALREQTAKLLASLADNLTADVALPKVA